MKDRGAIMEKRIYYHDTDAGGVVYYGTYLSYLEEGRTEFIENKGFNLVDLQKNNIWFAVRKCNLTYKAPARYGDTIICETTIKKMLAAQIIFHQIIKEKSSEKLLVESEVSLVCITNSFEPQQIPDGLRLKLTE